MGCTVAEWQVSDLATALQEFNHNGKRIVVPTFQRGSNRWDKSQEEGFIESLAKGFPVGSMLFYEKSTKEGVIDILIDGLQRGECIKKYVTMPNSFFSDQMVTDDDCGHIEEIIGRNDPGDSEYIRITLKNFIEGQSGFANIQFNRIGREIASHFLCNDYDTIDRVVDAIAGIFSRVQKSYLDIIGTMIPVVTYTGSEKNLPDIFRLINSKGTPLNEYEIYAAAWPIEERYRTSNKNIIEYVNAKYQETEDEGYYVYGYDKNELIKNKNVNAFEYVFGLSKYLASKYNVLLGFQKAKFAPSEVNPIGFELLNVCLNDSDRKDKLYERIGEIGNLDDFEKALCEAINFVYDAVRPIISFKGNVRGLRNNFLHSKFQIISMISTTFKKMYAGNYRTKSAKWDTCKDALQRNLLQYYVYDIITDYWSEGVGKKVFDVTNSDRYMDVISKKTWEEDLNGFYNKSMRRNEGIIGKKKGKSDIQGPKSEEFVFLNCIYLDKFSANEQLATNQKFDVEHLSTKGKMKSFIAATNPGPSMGLPISCIANLCYLPEDLNRSKKDDNIYQDQDYLNRRDGRIEIEEIEDKYSFTTRDDLEWMDRTYSESGENDFVKLKQEYTRFCDNRFEKMKGMLYDFLKINKE